MKTTFNRVAPFIFFLLIAFAHTIPVEASKSVTWSSSQMPSLSYFWNGGLSISNFTSDIVPLNSDLSCSSIFGPIAGCGWANGLASGATAQVTYRAKIIDNTTGQEIPNSASVPVGTQIRVVRDTSSLDTDISWVGTGLSSDSPYGRWVTNAGPVSTACKSEDFLNNVVDANNIMYKTYLLFNTNPPQTSVVSQSSNFTCVGDLCTVTGTGLISMKMDFSSTYGKFFYRYKQDGICHANNVPMRSGQTTGGSGFCYGDSCIPPPDYTLTIPAQTITFTLNAVSANNPPNPPTIGGSSNTNTGTNNPFLFSATDPDNDQIRYAIDWNNDGLVDQYAPSTGFVNSGTVRAAYRTWSTIGTYTFQARAEDENAGVSGWTIHTITVANASTQASIVADKVVCRTENLLPNWSYSGKIIDSTTVENFLGTTCGVCKKVPWEFQWVYWNEVLDPGSNPGTNVAYGGSPWRTFTSGTLTQIDPAQGNLWVREVRNNNFVPFSNSGSSVSAEIWCHDDVKEYDNHDRIEGAVANQTYYCAAFNAPTSAAYYDTNFASLPDVASCPAVVPTTPTATISASNCTIPVGASSCNSTVTWSSTDTTAPSVRQDGIQFSTTPTSNVTRSVGNGTHTFSFYDNGVELASGTMTSICASGSGWNGSSCATAAVTLVADNISCPSETDLPNWGDAAGPFVDATTVNTFLAAHPSCTRQPAQMQWKATSGVENPGDNTGTSPLWNTFNGSVNIPLTAIQSLSRFSVRAVWNNTYVPFAGAQYIPAVSSELSCYTDTQRYDNYEWIRSPFTAGDTYYCIFFTSSVTQCSDGLDNDGDGQTDLTDPGCTDATDTDETDPVIPSLIWNASGCTIPAGGATCQGNIFWQFDNIVAPENYFIRNTTTGNTIGNTETSGGTITTLLQQGDNILTATANGVSDQKTVRASCASTDTWYSNVCTAPPAVALTPASTFVRKGNTTRVDATIASPNSVTCTILNAQSAPITFTHNGTINPTQTYPYTTKSLNAKQIVTINCTDNATGLTNTEDTTIEVIPDIQEI